MSEVNGHEVLSETTEPKCALLTKRNLVKNVATVIEVSRKEAAEIVERILDGIARATPVAIALRSADLGPSARVNGHRGWRATQKPVYELTCRPREFHSSNPARNFVTCLRNPEADAMSFALDAVPQANLWLTPTLGCQAGTGVQKSL
jgi:hypothetical protein